MAPQRESAARPRPQPQTGLRPDREGLRLLFERSGLRLSPAQLEQFWRFHELLRARNAELDLTRLHSFENMVLKLYVDSAIVATLVDLPSPLLDLGTGAGFPGIPLKIVRPDIHLVLAEAKPSRVEFLHEAVRHLGLQGVDIVSHRIGRKFAGQVAGVITRAVEAMAETLHHVSAWLPLGGRVLFMKGPASQEDLEAMQSAFGTAYRITLDRRYSIPQTPHERRLIVVERIAGSPGTAAAGEDVTAGADAVALADVETAATGAGYDWDAEEPVPDIDDLESQAAPFGPPAHDEAEAAAAAETLAERAVPRPARRPAQRRLRDIESTTNPTFKQLLALHSGRGVRRTGLALVAGTRPVREVLRDFPARCVAWVSDGAGPDPDVPEHVAWYRMSRDLFRRVDTTGAGAPLLVVRVPDFPLWSDGDWPPGCTLFVPFQDPENVGAILRSAAAFGVARVVLLAEAANPFHPKSVRAAGGSALLRLHFLRGPSIRSLEVRQVPLLALSAVGRDIGHCRFPARFGLLPGLEGPGLPAPLQTPETLRIPMQPGIESLNAAAATAIALYLWRQQCPAPAGAGQ